MQSASLTFIAYGLLTAWVVSWFSGQALRSGVVLMASLLFLALLGTPPLGFVPLALFLLFGYACVQLIGRFNRLLPIGIVATVVAFAYLKKYAFFPDSVLIAHPYFTLGLSYIFFRVLHLVIESPAMPPGERPGFLTYLTYNLNFTTLVSGPIQRFDDFQARLSADREERLDAATIALQLARIAVGYFKVNVVASLLDMIRANAFFALGQASGTDSHFVAAFALILVYPFYLYCNFSGYIDIVIALARLMKIRLPENFDRPFSATSFIDFWNRWHITLSQWLKSYVYNPLLIFLMRRITSNTVQAYLAVLCFFVTFFLVGLWHGRTSEFAVFGLLQGGGVAGNKLWQIFLGKRLGKKGYKALAGKVAYQALGRGLTFAWFALTLLWFWGDWRQIRTVFASLPTPEWIALAIALVLITGAGLTLAAWMRERAARLSRRAQGQIYLAPPLLGAVLFASFFYCALLDQPAPGIVYKAF